MSDFENLVWEHKFRPNMVNDIVLPATTKKMLSEFIASGSVPNMLFSGVGGVGKTTVAKAIAHELGADILFVNASLDANLDALRTNISQFVSSVSFSGGKKIVVFDEADHLSSTHVQPALRAYMDEFSSNAIFLFTANFPSRIIAPLLSRLTQVDFKFSKEEKQPAAMSMLKRCCTILDSENIKYDKKAVAGVVSKNFPDFRKTLGELQRYSTSGEIDSGILAIGAESTAAELIVAIKEKNFGKCRQWVANNTLDSQTFYRSVLYDKLMPELVPQTIPPAILIIADGQYKASNSVDQEIAQIATIIELMTTVQFK